MDFPIHKCFFVQNLLEKSRDTNNHVVDKLTAKNDIHCENSLSNKGCVKDQ